MRKLTLFFALIIVSITMSSCVLYKMIVFSSKDIEVSNACEGEKFDFKLISLVGDKEAQTMTLNCKIINRDVTKSVKIGNNLMAYDSEGVAHSSSKIQTIHIKTDKSAKVAIQIPGQVVPRKVKKMAAIAFDVDDCHIEVKNVPVVWEKRKK
ncbi:MAG: hypothetical protein IKS65_06210 [Bacteroidales bacterium]|nr:hypothetical protein [Bacteroidales bacterium]